MGERGNVDIFELTDESVDDVVRIHRGALAHTLNSRLGAPHLKYLYQAMARLSGAYVGIAKTDGCTVGVVSGTVDPSGVTTQLLRRAPLSIVLRAGLKILRDPGLIGLWWNVRQIAAPISFDGDEVSAVLTAIAVDPGREGEGVGQALVRSFEDFLRQAGVRVYRLDTEVSNERALAFYKRLGFSEAARRANSAVLVRSFA